MNGRDRRLVVLLRAAGEVVDDSECHGVLPVVRWVDIFLRKEIYSGSWRSQDQRARVPRPRGVGVVGRADDAAPHGAAGARRRVAPRARIWPSPSSMCSSRCSTRRIIASACRPLADRVLLSPAGTTHLVTRLERDGWFAGKSTRPTGRKWFTVLTAEGDRTLRAARPTHNDVLRRTLLPPPHRPNAGPCAVSGSGSPSRNRPH